MNSTQANTSVSDVEKLARRRAGAKMGWYIHAFVYVLEGSIVMAVSGGEEVTLTAGQTFYEGPDDIHTVGRNASNTEPARFVVLLLKKRDEPILTPVQIKLLTAWVWGLSNKPDAQAQPAPPAGPAD